jgi:hypothetical protein
MKSIFIKLSFYIVLFTLSGTSCELFTNPVQAPGISIYKTNDDYFDLVSIGMKGDKIFRTSSFSFTKSKFIITDNDTIYKYRVRLINGYVLDGEADERYDVFLNLTFKQHMILEKKYGHYVLSPDTLKKHIIDNDPYIEYYREVADPRKFSKSGGVDDIDTSEINQIIREGKIEQFFQRLK